MAQQQRTYSSTLFPPIQSTPLPSSFTCDFTEFKDVLVDLRKANDNFKFTLNKVTSPTQCDEIWNQLSTVMAFRKNAIKTCMDQSSELLQQTQQSPNTDKKQIKQLENKIDLLREEMDIEEILFRQSEKLYKRACPSYGR